jgi:2'-5' RNA ligase
MKIFALYLKLSIIEKPEWFDSFRAIYDKPYDVHLTLIQPRYIEDEQVPLMKLKVDELIHKYKFTDEYKIIDFTELICEKEDQTYLMMLFPKDFGIFPDYQKALRNSLGEYTNYIKEISREYESNFKPHITIGRDIPEDLIDQAKSYFNEMPVIKATANKLVLSVVSDLSIEEVKNPNNLTIFNY